MRSVAVAVSPVAPFLVVAVAAIATLIEMHRGPLTKRDTGGAPALGMAMVAMMMPVIDEWAHARSNGAYVGGLLPYSDGRGYHEGALHLLHDGALSTWDSRRPLNPAFLAGRIALAGGDFRVALLLQAALAGGSAFLAGRAIGQDLGLAPGAITYAVLMLFSARWMPTVWTEPLGLTLGSLSFAALWHAARTKSLPAIAAAFALLVLAQNARAGAVLVIPVLLWWVMRLPGGGGRFHWRLLLGATAGIGFGWGCNRAVAILNGATTHVGHGAFSYTLYGLTHGGTNWISAFRDHPELYWLSAADDAAAANVTYSLAMDEFRRHPMGLFVGLWVGVDSFVDAWTEALSAGLLSRHRILQWIYFLVLVAGVARLVRRLRRIHGPDPALSMVLAAGAGMIASIPIIYADGGERVFAATIPFVAALVAMVLSSVRRAAPSMTPADHALRWVPAAVIGASIVLVAVIGPRLGRRWLGGWAASAPASPPCGEGQVGLSVVGTPASPKIDIVADGVKTFVPLVAYDAYEDGLRTPPGARKPNPSSDTFAGLPANTTLALAYDLSSRTTKFVAGPRGWLEDGRILSICTRPEGSGGVAQMGTAHFAGTDVYRMPP
jgi:hypothetical protein